VKERFFNVIAWIGLFSLAFGVIPLGGMAIGYQLENMQEELNFWEVSCDHDNIKGLTSIYQGIQDNPDRAKRAKEEGVEVEKFDPEKCRVAGSGSVTIWRSEKKYGFIYAKLSDAQIRERLGYRTFFHDLSDERWFLTLLLALPWLPFILLLYVMTGNFRILPWKKH